MTSGPRPSLQMKKHNRLWITGTEHAGDGRPIPDRLN